MPKRLHQRFILIDIPIKVKQKWLDTENFLHTTSVGYSYRYVK